MAVENKPTAEDVLFVYEATVFCMISALGGDMPDWLKSQILACCEAHKAFWGEDPMFSESAWAARRKHLEEICNKSS